MAIARSLRSLRMTIGLRMTIPDAGFATNVIIVANEPF
jgi:hypothetical protein